MHGGLQVVAGIAALLLILLVLQDAFETMVLPRRVNRRLRISRLFIEGVWHVGAALDAAVDRALYQGRPHESYLSIIFGPLSLILLLIVWAAGLIVGFGALLWGLGSPLRVPPDISPLAADIYMSGTNFFTIGLGDVTPTSPLARLVTVVEGGIGLGFLALVISYLPVLYQAFSSREELVSLLDARAGSPPTALEILRRTVRTHGAPNLDMILLDWERWAAQVLESHLSYPVLAYFRSQHENQSWLAALTAILDTCALLLTGFEEIPEGQAQLTFAMGRHTVVDLSGIFHSRPSREGPDRLPPEEWELLRASLAAAGLRFRDEADAPRRLRELRRTYEPYVRSLSRHLEMPLPGWVPTRHAHDAWETSRWETGTGLRAFKP